MLTTIFLSATIQSTTKITLDPTQTTPVSPYIYGANFPEWDKLRTPFTVARLGGNRLTAYNWESNASNAGNDYRNQNDGYMGESNEPGRTALDFLSASEANKAKAIITIPTAGYVSADKGPDNDVNLTPDYLNVRFHKSLAEKPGHSYSSQPNTSDKVVYQDEFAKFLSKAAKNKQNLWFSLDNEPDLWHHTHSRIVLKQPGYADIIANNIEFAKNLKRVAPESLIFGPANYGWQGFRTFQNAPDANNRDFLDVYLAALAQAEKVSKTRLLDVLDIHWYPEARGNGQRIVMGNPNADNSEARIQAPRSLWDPTYVEDSWIAESIGKKPIALLPGVMRQIKSHYPGTKLALTEYDYGGQHDSSGAVAQADVLGIFGRYGLFAACHWGISENRPATLAGFRAFLDYDGKGSKFLSNQIKVQGETAAYNSVYASTDKAHPHRITAVLINKTDSAQSFSIMVPRRKPKAAACFQANPKSPLEPIAIPSKTTSNHAETTVPARSVATIRIDLEPTS